MKIKSSTKYTNNSYASLLTLMLIATPIKKFWHLNITSPSLARLPGLQTTEQLKQLRQKQRQIPIATSIEGTISTPIVWTDNVQSSETRSTITLNEPLLYSNGDTALSQDSSLIVEVDNWDGAGFVTLKVVAVIYKNSQGDLVQSLLPEKALLIRNKDNKPLSFDVKDSGGNPLVNDFFNEALQSGINSLPLPASINSSVSRTLRNNARKSRRRSGRNAIYSVRENTTVSIYVNSFISIED
ncbi:MAG: hypothetical protein AAFO95_15965 [Cyanobacteria bacterium J06600_6]